MIGVARIALWLGVSSVTLASAAPAAAEPACGADNQMARGRLVAAYDAAPQTDRATDGRAAAPGAEWTSAAAVVLYSEAAFLTYDLGEPRQLSALYLQADANDSYDLLGSDDGVRWWLLARAPPVSGDGLRERALSIAPTRVRFVRVAEPRGDGSYSVAELQAFCRAPAPFPPRLGMVAATTDDPAGPRHWPEASAVLQLLLACLGLALLWWGARRARIADAAARVRRRERVLLAVLGVLAFGAYLNFCSFHFGKLVHYHDAFHYYIGAKYFDELGYDRFYECVAVVDAEDPRLRARVERRKLRDADTNLLVSTADALAHPERCTARFSPERWREFGRDVAFFRGHFSPQRWARVQSDHGYNATPVWTALGSALCNLTAASELQLAALALIDIALLCGMCALIAWAFGWRVLCVALLVLATNYPSRFYWTGGSILRWDWLALLVAGICCLRRDRPLLAGACLAYSALLRLFPVFAFAGPALAVGSYAWSRLRARRQPDAPPPELDPRLPRLFAGAALATLALLVVSLVGAGGPRTWRAFADNTEVHAATPLTNHMGLGAVIAYHPERTGHHLRSSDLDDPWQEWKLAQLRTRRDRRWLWELCAIAAIALLARAVRRAEPWQAVALGTSLIAVVPVLTCYYYAFLIAPALLCARDRAVATVLLAVTAAGGLVAWAPTQFLPWTALHLLPMWTDELYVTLSVFTLVGLAVILWRFARQPVDASARYGFGGAVSNLAELGRTPRPRPDASRASRSRSG